MNLLLNNEENEFVIKQGRKGISQICYQVLLKFLDRSKTYKLLEVGMGTGIFTEFLEKNKALDIYGLDVNLNFLNYAIDEKRVDSSKVMVADFNVLPFADNIFDIYTGLAILHYRVSIEKFYNEVFRVVKNGGIIFFPFPVNKKELVIREKKYLEGYNIEIIEEGEWYFIGRVIKRT